MSDRDATPCDPHVILSEAKDLGFPATKVKLCGMFRPCDLEAVAAAKPDYVGFIVNFPMSHRSLTPDQLVDLLAAVPLPLSIKKVGVFVDEPPASVARIVEDAGLDCVQLHGHEDEAYLAELRLVCDAELIQAFRVRSESDLDAARASSADLVLLDNGQGTGEKFDWSLVRGFDRPFLLAGGLTPANVAEAIRAVSPFGVDMSSGLETEHLKDPAKISAAVAAVRNS